MKKPECILVRTGEIYLKSEQVQRNFTRILLNNITAGLKGRKIEFRIEAIPNRIFIFTKDIEKAMKVLRRIFGITSLSPVWICDSTIQDMRKTSGLVAKSVLKIKKDDSFAIRARRAGSHNFNSQDIGREAGDEVNVITSARVDLTNPDHEIFIECRQKRAYVFTGRVSGPGGLPLGSAGRIIALLNDKNSVVAAWMMMKRGCQIIAAYRRKELLDAVKRWHIGKKLDSYRLGSLDSIIKRTHTYIICTSKGDYKKGLLILDPLMALGSDKIADISKIVLSED